MKKILFLVICLLASFSLYAQIGNDLTIYTSGGEKFTLIVHGKAVNEAPAASVTLENSHHEILRVTIKFEDPNIPDLVDKVVNIQMMGCDDCPTSAVHKIFEKKGKWKIRGESLSEKKIQTPVQQIIINQN